MSFAGSPHTTSDQTLVSVSFNFGNPSLKGSPRNCHCLHNLGNLLTATQVCQNWCESILNDARLWTEVEFTVQSARGVKALTRVLGLSKEFPLHLSINFGKPSAAGDAALDQLLDVSSRCASLDLKIPYELYVILLMSCRASPFSGASCTRPSTLRLLRSWMEVALFGTVSLRWNICGCH
ncbi:hypothetical protein CPB85DRAFT_1447425 [Mucidula mucida]|nr:hypothetical protein CPB85DRAFT_1447425 [Mucidula mucida]